ncbi:MAG: hypothetical protein H6739_34620 [Alphaproteobacteria bacterium]|nr:hypothetical protein [Alphaproteobacteria bacterium]
MRVTLEALVEWVRGRLPVGVSEAELEGFVARRRPELERLLAAAGFVRRLSVTWFASGTNHPGEVRGWAAVGQPVGVSVSELGRRGMMGALAKLAGTGARVFVDSGAFSETEASPITEADWSRKLEVYEVLARRLGGQVALVAPDKVGDAVVSARRLARWALRVSGLVELGAELIVPLQRGPGGLVGAWETARGLLDVPFTPAIPGNKAAASDEEVAELLAVARPARLHILGMGPRRQRAARLLALAAWHSPETAVSMDSNRRRAMVGRSWAAPLTLAEDRAAEELAELSRAGERIRGSEDFYVDDYTDAIGEPSSWMSMAARRRTARLAVPRGSRGRFVVEPEGVLHGDCGEKERPRWCWELEVAIEGEWDRYWMSETVAERKRRGVVAVAG